MPLRIQPRPLEELCIQSVGLLITHFCQAIQSLYLHSAQGSALELSRIKFEIEKAVCLMQERIWTSTAVQFHDKIAQEILVSMNFFLFS